jgi:chromate transporter
MRASHELQARARHCDKSERSDMNDAEVTSTSLKGPSFWQWVRLNTELGSLSFGGSGRILLFQNALVDDKKWLSETEFREGVTLSAVFPGPNLTNLSIYFGYRFVGFFGTFVALLGLSLPGAFVALAINAGVNLDNRHVIWIFQGFSLASIVLFSMFVLRLGQGLPEGAIAGSKVRFTKLFCRVLVALAIGAANLMSVPLLWILVLGIAACLAVEFLL